MQEFEKLQELLVACTEDIDKFSRGNKSAGTRIRKAMQEVKSQAQEVRKAILSKDK